MHDVRSPIIIDRICKIITSFWYTICVRLIWWTRRWRSQRCIWRRRWIGWRRWIWKMQFTIKKWGTQNITSSSHRKLCKKFVRISEISLSICYRLYRLPEDSSLLLLFIFDFFSFSFCGESSPDDEEAIHFPFKTGLFSSSKDFPVTKHLSELVSFSEGFVVTKPLSDCFSSLVRDLSIKTNWNFSLMLTTS